MTIIQLVYVLSLNSVPNWKRTIYFHGKIFYLSNYLSLVNLLGDIILPDPTYNLLKPMA